MANDNDTRQETDRRFLMLGLRIVGEFGAIIAVPVVAFALFGRWLDDVFGTRPGFLIAGFVLAALITARGVYVKARLFAKEYETLLNIQDKTSKK